MSPSLVLLLLLAFGRLAELSPHHLRSPAWATHPRGRPRGAAGAHRRFTIVGHRAGPQNLVTGSPSWATSRTQELITAHHRGRHRPAARTHHRFTIVGNPRCVAGPIFGRASHWALWTFLQRRSASAGAHKRIPWAAGVGASLCGPRDPEQWSPLGGAAGQATGSRLASPARPTSRRAGPCSCL